MFYSICPPASPLARAASQVCSRGRLSTRQQPPWLPALKQLTLPFNKHSKAARMRAEGVWLGEDMRISGPSLLLQQQQQQQQA